MVRRGFSDIVWRGILILILAGSAHHPSQAGKQGGCHGIPRPKAEYALRYRQKLI
jgi:hypothetical protein